VDAGDLRLRAGHGETDVSLFYQLYFKTRKRLGLPSHPYKLFKNLFDVFSPEGRITLLFAEKEGKAVGGLIVFKYKDRVSSEYLASDIAFRHMNIDYFLYWNAIAMACREGYRVYDFGRTAFDNSSLLEFKRKWGTEELDLPQYCYSKDAHNESMNPESSSFYRLTSHVCKHAPDFAYSLIGDICYRHLG
jgi:lipid II:glycine glycyltransferase (peptidoglycan interpeptide bridge formation enzyme)